MPPWDSNTIASRRVGSVVGAAARATAAAMVVQAAATAAATEAAVPVASGVVAMGACCIGCGGVGARYQRGSRCPC